MPLSPSARNLQYIKMRAEQFIISYRYVLRQIGKRDLTCWFTSIYSTDKICYEQIKHSKGDVRS